VKLVGKQQRFVEEYLLDLNAAQAAIRAGYSRRTAKEQASRLLTKVNVQAAITAAQVRRSHRTELRQDTVLLELFLLAHSDIAHYRIDDRGEVHVREGIPEAATRAISSLKKKITHTDAGISYETTISLWHKPSTLRMVGEHLALFQGAAPVLPNVHVHIHTARERLADRLTHLATRHAEDATNGH
jgi:phage terminase small subunit